MSIYDKASLVLIPSGTKTSKIFSQKPVNGDGDFTFSRSTAATRVNADGNIEKETQNLALQSNSFNNWTNYLTTETGGQADRSGGTSAWLLEKTGSGGSIYRTHSTSGVATFSAYVKAGTLNWVRLDFTGGGSKGYFDLQNGVVGSVTGSPIDSAIEDAGNGWYRCSITTTSVGSGVGIVPAESDGSISGTSGNIYIQDAQLEQGLVARDYIETTTAAVEGGITDNVPRLDYTDSSCPALLLEPQRTNVVPNSELFDPAYSTYYNFNISPVVTINYGTSPEGLSNSSRLDTAAANSGWYTDGQSASSGETYTCSIFAKLVSGSESDIVRFGFSLNGDKLSRYDLSDGTINYSHPDATTSIEDYGNDWYRLIQTITTTSSGTLREVLYSYNNAGDYEIYGHQVEAGSYATSYIPTYGTSVTRNADACFGAGNTATFNSTEGVLYFEGSAISSNDSTFKRIAIGTSDLNFVNNINLRYDTSGTSVTYQYRAGNVYQADLTIPINQTDVNKIACVWKVNRFEIWLNGVKASEDTIGSVISANTLDTMYYGKTTTFSEPLYGKTNQVLVFPTALSDEELAALTTI